MQTIRTAGHRYWNPCGSLLAFYGKKFIMFSIVCNPMRSRRMVGMGL